MKKVRSEKTNQPTGVSNRTMGRREFVGGAAAILAGAATYRTGVARADSAATSLKTLDGSTIAVDNSAVTELKKGLKGDFLVDGLPDYDAARHIWNAAIDRRPAIIIRCADADDIVRSVRFARRHNALVSVRAGGHNAVGFAINDGGLTIDLTRLRDVQVDQSARTARVGGGATFADFDGATHKFGLASTGPIISMVGVGGYTLGGGMGWLHRKLGLGCDNLISAKVVTADGRIVEASKTSHSDLYWAIRGGGGNFGIISNFEFRLAPVSDVLAGLVFHPLEDLPKVASFVRDFNDHAPDDVCVWLMMRKAPASPLLPTEMHGRLVATIAACYASADEDGDKALAPLRQFGRPLIDLVKRRAYSDWQKALDPSWGNGFHNQWIGHYLPELTDGAAQTMLEYVSKVTSPATDVKLINLGGAVARVDEDATAFGYRKSKYALVIQTRWAKADETAQHLAWSQEFFDAMKVHSTGKVYVNFIADEGAKRVMDAYNPEAFKRLQAIKAKYDPRNQFRMNQNIPPSPRA
ncbi:MAG: FAD-binding oxidoreductase [Steroidobacteraceae bacterium]|jgi:FAD/FMN-containing dehydrogenase